MIDLQVRFQRKMNAIPGDVHLRQIPWRVGVPLLECAAIEEMADLRERWAALLASFANADSGTTIHKSFVTVLAELPPPGGRDHGQGLCPSRSFRGAICKCRSIDCEAATPSGTSTDRNADGKGGTVSRSSTCAREPCEVGTGRSTQHVWSRGCVLASVSMQFWPGIHAGVYLVSPAHRVARVLLRPPDL